MFPGVLSPFKQEFRSWYDKLSHLHPKSMFRIEKLEVIPSRFIDLNDDVLLCVSSMFVTASRR